MPSLGLINDIKGLRDTFQSLLVASVTFKDSVTAPTTLLLSTHDLNVTFGNQPNGIANFPYNNTDFMGVIQNQEVAATQALSAEGIDITPTVTLDLLDATKTIWNNYEKAIGFKGATLKLYFIFWDAYTSSYSSDYRTIFTGLCSGAKVRETRLSVTAISKLNMNQLFLPTARIQKRCIWNFPDITGMTLADATARHQEAADNPSSQFWNCGYSFLASGPNKVGNKPSGDIAYRNCDYTFENCVLNLGDPTLNYSPFSPIEKDSAGHPTARFGGVTWTPPNSYISRGFGQSNNTKGFNALNEGKYNDYVPIGWGTYWIDPIVLNISGDANFTAMDVLLGHGQFSNIRHVICNDIDVDRWATDSGTQKSQISLQLFWRDISSGDRTGACNHAEVIQGGKGDPYGGLKVIDVHVPSQLTPTSNIPRIRVLVDGPLLAKFHPITSSVVAGGTATVNFSGVADFPPTTTFPVFVTGALDADLNGGWVNATLAGSTLTFPTTAGAESVGAGGFIAYDVFTTNPAWIMMDALNWLGWKYTELGIQTFCDAAVYYDGNISYNGISGFVDVAVDGISITWDSGNDFSQIVPGQNVFINGQLKVVNAVTDSTHFTITIGFGTFLHNVTFLASGSNTHARFKMGLGYSQRTSGTEIIRQMRTACRSILIPDPVTGQLKLLPKRGLAEQQSGVMPGSNFNTQISSFTSAGVVAGGYVAWKFSYSDILPQGNGESSLQIDQLDIKTAPNKISIPFTDEDNQYQEDSITVVDAQDITRVERPIEGTISAAGLLNFDTAQRVISVWMAENSRGNARFDSGGSYLISFNTTFRCQHLSVGDIVLMDYPQLGITSNLKDMANNPISGFLARVSAIKPATNFENAQITIQYSDDGWYVDTFGQNGINVRKFSQQRNYLGRPPFPWSPFQLQPSAGDAFHSTTDWQLGVYQEYDSSASRQPLAVVHASGKVPITVFAPNSLPPPTIAAQGTTAGAGGSVKAGRTYYGQVCGYDVNGKITTPSDPTQPCTIAVPAGADTATLTFPVVQWPAGTASYELFVGVLRSKMSAQATGAVTGPSTPANITITNYQDDTWGIPDVECNSISTRVRRCMHAGDIGAEVKAVTSASIQISTLTGEPLAAHQFAPSGGFPYYLMLVGLKNNSSLLPIANWAIADNTGDTFTFAGGAIDPTTIDRGDGTFGINPGDVVVVTMRPTVGSDSGGNFIQDTNWVNALNPLFDSHAIVDASNASPIIITLTEDPDVSTGDKVYINGVIGNLNANGSFFVTRLSALTYSLYSDAALTTPVAGSGAYVSGGTFQKQDQGLAPNAEVGRELYCIQGTGAGLWYKIKSNTKDKIYIEGDWKITPDGSSVFVVNVSNWEFETDSDTINNSVYSTYVDFPVTTPNYLNQLLFAQCFTLDSGKNESFRAESPFRLIWLFGQDVTTAQVNDGYVPLVIATNAVTPDLGDGINFKLILNQAPQVTIKNAVFTSGAILPGAKMTIYVWQDGTGHRPTPAWDTAYAADVPQQISADAGARGMFKLVFHDDNLWHLDFFN